MRHPNFLLPRATQGYFEVRRENDDKKEPLLFMLDTLRVILQEVRHVARVGDKLDMSVLNPTSKNQWLHIS